jgi:hypothetical protein
LRLYCAASLLLSILLAACGAGAPVKAPVPVQAALPTPPDENYHHLNFDQKLDYLAALLQFRAGASLRADQASADQEMRRVLSAMSLDERGYTAAGVYLLLLRGPGRPPSNVERTPWEKDLLAVAQNDPVLTGAIARRNFVPFPLFQWNTDSINSFQDSLKQSLIFDATHGNAQACSALANLDYKTLSDQAFKRETCAGVPGAPPIYRVEAQAWAQARQRTAQIDQAERADALKLAQYCASVGVPVTSFNNIDRGRSQERALTADQLPDRNLLRTNPIQFSEDVADNLSRSAELQKLWTGSMITPILTPRTFKSMARPMCGG